MSSTLARRPGASADRRRRPSACGATPAVLVELLLSALEQAAIPLRQGPPSRHRSYNLHNAPTDPLGGRVPSTVTRCRSSQWTGALVALRNTLAFQLRFSMAPPATTAVLREEDDRVGARGKPSRARALARLPAPLALRRAARLPRHVARGVLAVVLLTVAAVAGGSTGAPHRGHGGAQHTGRHHYNLVAVVLPNGDDPAIRPAVARSARRRAGTRAELLRAPAAGRLPRRAQGRAHRADRRSRRGREAWSRARSCANASFGLVPVGFVDDDPGEAAGCASTACACAATHRRRASAHPRRHPSPTEVIIAIPSAPGATRARHRA